MGSNSWKEKERLVAKWFGSHRNPLSGRNNIADDGSRRLGDIVYKHAVIEVKHKKTVNVDVGAETRKLADGRPWLVFEFKVARSGSAPEASLVKITCDHKTAAFICDALKKRHEEGLV